MLLGPLAARDDARLVAIADPLESVRTDLATRFGVQASAEVADLFADPAVGAVYVATPTDLHAEHVLAAAAAGKHILVEKPMAVDLADAQRMIDAATRAGVILMVGQSQSYGAPYAAMREVVTSGRLGRVRLMLNVCYTDWMYRPRRPEELDLALGGGVTFRQGAHQFDVLRLIGGGLVQKVSATTFDWDPRRPGLGAHSVQLTFADGAAATAIYNGYGAFLSSEICFDIGSGGSPQTVEAAGKSRRTFYEREPVEELSAKRKRSASAGTRKANHPFFGFTLVSCEGGDIRQSPDGLYLYTERGREVLVVPVRETHETMLAEFVDAIAGRRAPLHDGRWGKANLEVCVAAIESARSGREVELVDQVAAR
jgi:phthalate 4,5-cis-dihydrodiol dehydrogenase